MKAVIQTNYQGIDSLQLVSVKQPKPNPFGDVVKVASAPVLPWDIMSEQGQLRNLNPQRLSLVTVLQGRLLKAANYGELVKLANELLALPKVAALPNMPPLTSPYSHLSFPITSR